jgi:hypothetical protein
MVYRSSETHLRALLGEIVGDGQTAADTMFSDEEIRDLLEQGFENPKAAAYWGWMEKAANYASLVNVNEGNAARELSDLHRQALRMADRYVGYVETPSRGRARMGKIIRERN